MKFFGHPICVSGISKLMGIGSDRMTKMVRAFRRNDPCPADGRLISKPRRVGVHETVSKKRQVCYSVCLDVFRRLQNIVSENRVNIKLKHNYS